MRNLTRAINIYADLNSEEEDDLEFEDMSGEYANEENIAMAEHIWELLNETGDDRWEQLYNILNLASPVWGEAKDRVLLVRRALKNGVDVQRRINEAIAEFVVVVDGFVKAAEEMGIEARFAGL